MRIVEYYAENFKRLRFVNFKPKGRMTIFTGKNGQGKTSALDGISYALGGKKWSPEVPTRKGANSNKVQLKLSGESSFTVTRTQSGLKLEMAEGCKAWGTPQDMLDGIFNELALDPIEFIRLKPAQQVEMLRKCVKMGVDIDALNAENLQDYQRRREINKEVDRLRAEAAGIPVQENLPKNKQDEQKILKQLNDAHAETQRAMQINRDKQELGSRATQLSQRKESMAQRIESLKAQLKAIENDLKASTDELSELDKQHKAAEKKHQDAPEGKVPDVADLTRQLSEVQLINREIDKRTRREAIEKQRDEQDALSKKLTRAMEDRDEKKRAALANAKMPVEGLTFDEEKVLFEGVPIQQLGEAQQIRISVSLVLAANPKLRLVRIPHGESLDEDSIAELAKMAEEQDFYVWMARVDSSGTMGIVIEDGEIKTINDNEGDVNEGESEGDQDNGQVRKQTGRTRKGSETRS